MIDSLAVLSLVGALLIGAAAIGGYLAGRWHERSLDAIAPPLDYRDMLISQAATLHSSDDRHALWSDDDEAYIATSSAWTGASAFGDTPEQAHAELCVAIEMMADVEREDRYAGLLKGYASMGEWQGLAVVVEHDEPCPVDGHDLSLMTAVDCPEVSTGYLFCQACGGWGRAPADMSLAADNILPPDMFYKHMRATLAGAALPDPARDVAGAAAMAIGRAEDAAIVGDKA